MRRMLLVLAMIALLVATVAVGPAFAAKKKAKVAKVPVCHNLAHNPHTIMVAPSALKAHLAHGDAPGVCPTLPPA